MNIQSSDDDNDSDTDSNSSKNNQPFVKRPSLRGRNLAKGVNLIINNSIDSHMLTNSFHLKDNQPGGIVLNRKTTESNLKKNYQQNFINRCNYSVFSFDYWDRIR